VARKYGTNDSMKLVLTFDDGPDPDYTPKILDILSKYHVPATFFVIGINAENNIPIVKREFREGHEIGNHTFTHPNIAKVSQRRAILEIESTRLLIECITGDRRSCSGPLQCGLRAREMGGADTCRHCPQTELPGHRRIHRSAGLGAGRIG
jgi:peptidoglycan/xylan/chitin deacetylase (PgdA/CDA1 family)